MAPSSDEPPLVVRKYDKDLNEALAPGEAGHYDKAHEAAQYNLTDPRLPRWHQIKNMIVSFIAIDDLQQKQRLRLRAEKVYEEARLFTPATDKYDNEALANLRKELDDLKKWEDEEREEGEEGFEDDDFPEDEEWDAEYVKMFEAEDAKVRQEIEEKRSQSKQPTEETLSATDPAAADMPAGEGKSPATPTKPLLPPPGTLRMPFSGTPAAPGEGTGPLRIQEIRRMSESTVTPQSAYGRKKAEYEVKKGELSSNVNKIQALENQRKVLEKSLQGVTQELDKLKEGTGTLRADLQALEAEFPGLVAIDDGR